MTSLNKSIHKVVENNINIFAQNIAKNFDLNVDEVLELWYDDSDKKTSTKDKTKSKDRKCYLNLEEKVANTGDSISDSDLAKSTNAELKAICKSKGLKTTGKKSDLLDRILGKDVSTKDKSIKKSSKKIEKTPLVQKKIQSNLTTIQLRRNKFGNYEHPDTKLVFSKDRIVIGKQDSSGVVMDLVSNDIDICNQYKFKYHLPENLDSKDSNQVKVAEIDDDDSELDDEGEGEGEEDESASDTADELSDFYESD